MPGSTLEHQVSQVRISRVLREVTIKCYKDGGVRGGGVTLLDLHKVGFSWLQLRLQLPRSKSGENRAHRFTLINLSVKRQKDKQRQYLSKRRGPESFPNAVIQACVCLGREGGGGGEGVSIKTQFIIQWRMPSLISGGSALMCEEGRWESPTYL